jgi:hypothetical protein
LWITVICVFPVWVWRCHFPFLSLLLPPPCLTIAAIECIRPGSIDTHVVNT